MRKIILALLVLSAPAAAQAMSVSQFLGKVDALHKKGPMALFSKDIGLLKAEVKDAGKALRLEQNVALKTGRKPPVCMPKRATTDSDELLAHFRAIPPAQRGMSVKSAFAALMNKKYPCPA